MANIEKTPSNGAHLPAKEPTRDELIMGALVVFNQLRAYKLDRTDAIAWMNTILRIHPDIEIERLRLAIDGMISGQLDYDDKKGIKNIMSALKFVGQDEHGKWIIFKPLY